MLDDDLVGTSFHFFEADKVLEDSDVEIRFWWLIPSKIFQSFPSNKQATTPHPTLKKKTDKLGHQVLFCSPNPQILHKEKHPVDGSEIPNNHLGMYKTRCFSSPEALDIARSAPFLGWGGCFLLQLASWRSFKFNASVQSIWEKIQVTFADLRFFYCFCFDQMGLFKTTAVCTYIYIYIYMSFS